MKIQQPHTTTSSPDRSPIGIFDSGRGGYYTMEAIRKLLPQYDYLFYGDAAHMPYGGKTPEQIREYTFAGLQWLFDRGCKLVIIACNTAAAYSIRVRQATHPELKTLSVTIPGIEALIENKVRSTLFLSTTATSESGILPDLAYKYHYTGSLEIKACPWLADLIEEDLQTHFDDEKKKEIIRQYVGTSQAESVMLACTHYGVRYETFVQLFPDKIIIDPSQEAAKNLVDYLHRHPEIEKTLSKWWHVEEYWTKKL